MPGPGSSPALDVLGLGNQAMAMTQDEMDKIRKKRLEQQKMNKATGIQSPAYQSLLNAAGNQF